MKHTALVTGASGGIGRAVAAALLGDGYAVAMQAHTHPEALSPLLEQAAQTGAAALAVVADLRSEAEIAAMLQTVHERLGRVTLLVNCAGVALPQGLFADTTADDFAYVFDGNVKSAISVSRLAVPDMLAAGGGCIVSISSIWGVTGGSCEVLYSASKAALIGFTKALAKELAPSGVRVNCVAPGFVPTAMNAHLSAEAVLDIVEDIPLGRAAAPSDIAEAVLYMAKAAHVTGQTLLVDGGYCI